MSECSVSHNVSIRRRLKCRCFPQYPSAHCFISKEKHPCPSHTLWCSAQCCDCLAFPGALHKRSEAVLVGWNKIEDDGSSTLEVSPRLTHPTPCIKATSIKKKRCVIAVGHCLLKEMHGLIRRLDPLLREACCLPGAQVKDMNRKPPTLDMALRFLSITGYQVGSVEVAPRNPRAIKRLQGLGMTSQGMRSTRCVLYPSSCRE